MSDYEPDNPWGFLTGMTTTKLGEAIEYHKSSSVHKAPVITERDPDRKEVRI